MKPKRLKRTLGQILETDMSNDVKVENLMEVINAFNHDRDRRLAKFRFNWNVKHALSMRMVSMALRWAISQTGAITKENVTHATKMVVGNYIKEQRKLKNNYFYNKIKTLCKKYFS